MAGFKSASSASGCIGHIGDQGHAGFGGDFHGVVFQRRVHLNAIQAVFRGILLHDGHGQNDGHIAGGFAGQHAAAAEFPKIGIPGALYRAFHHIGPQL
jgi:hypothetical protein